MKLPWLSLLPFAAFSALAAAQDSSNSDWIKNPAMGNYKAYAEFKMANYQAARHIWEVLAGLGNPDALFNLGILAEDGLGETADIAKAEALYVASADAGGFKAQYRLGMLYSGPGGLPQNLDKARHYLTLASQAGDRDAAARLQSLANPGRPSTPFEQAELLASAGRHAEAAAIYQRLAELADNVAQTRLAWMYEAGRGVERNLGEAARRFALAGEAGNREAQYALAVMFKTGRGQPVDHQRSIAWLKRSAAQGYPPAKAALAAEETAD
jgi:TPR repeat protein